MTAIEFKNILISKFGLKNELFETLSEYYYDVYNLQIFVTRVKYDKRYLGNTRDGLEIDNVLIKWLINNNYCKIKNICKLERLNGKQNL